MRALKDRYGFLFWLKWIAGFAGSFVVSAAAWSAAFWKLFGAIEGEELVLSWCVCVFGTWFILVIPFMRKKEQIWKRLNDDQERAVDVWLTGMGFFIASYVASALGWSIALKHKIVPNTPGLDAAWAKPVFLTWFLLWIPLLVWMYRSADRIFRVAQARQTPRTPVFQKRWLDPEKRRLPARLSEKLKKQKQTLPGGHLVRGVLRNGQVIGHLFVLDSREVVGAYDLEPRDFDAAELESLDVIDPEKQPPLDEAKWVRFNLQ